MVFYGTLSLVGILTAALLQASGEVVPKFEGIL
jgi:hypothetical protein